MIEEGNNVGLNQSRGNKDSGRDKSEIKGDCTYRRRWGLKSSEWFSALVGAGS